MTKITCGANGTQDGVIGALAAVGLSASHDDGRIVQLGQWPDDLSGLQPLGALVTRGLEVREYGTGRPVETGVIDVGKHLRPNRRQGCDVLFVAPEPHSSAGPFFRAVRLP